MTAVEDALRMVLALPTEEQREVYVKLSEELAKPAEWTSMLHPSWQEELARRDAMPEEDDIPWEVVHREALDIIERKRAERDRGQAS